MDAASLSYCNFLVYSIFRFHIINGVNVEVKKAIPKEDTVAMARPVVYHSTSMMGSRAMPPYPYPGSC